jgi:hypothetical protein
MTQQDESLPVSLIKHPLVWSGAGLLIRYSGDHTQKGGFWSTIGVVCLGIGVAHAVATQPRPGLVTQ